MTFRVIHQYSLSYHPHLKYRIINTVIRCVLKLYRHDQSILIPIHGHKKNIVNIQDEEDFQKQVVDSAVPVIVDFHAMDTLFQCLDACICHGQVLRSLILTPAYPHISDIFGKTTSEKLGT